jgi:hypothetical protein
VAAVRGAAGAAGATPCAAGAPGLLRLACRAALPAGQPLEGAFGGRGQAHRVRQAPVVHAVAVAAHPRGARHRGRGGRAAAAALCAAAARDGPATVRDRDRPRRGPAPPGALRQVHQRAAARDRQGREGALRSGGQCTARRDGDVLQDARMGVDRRRAVEGFSAGPHGRRIEAADGTGVRGVWRDLRRRAGAAAEGLLPPVGKSASRSTG